MGEIRGSAGRAVQKRATRRDGWTRARRTRFLDELAASCNATRAADKAGMSTEGARRLRARDPEFAALWEEALQLGYQRLEEELLQQVLGQAGNDENPGPERTEPVRAAIDPQLALRVLQWRDARKPGRGRAMAMATMEDAQAELLRRLAQLERRLKGAQGTQR